MIFFTLILFVQSCFWKNEDMTLYPTNGEYLEYSMNQLLNIESDNNYFENNNFIYHYEPSVPNVQIANAFNEIAHIEGQEFISVSSNQTHFATITQENHVILYEWKNLNFQQYGQVVEIKEKYKCYNIILFADIYVLLDCYAEEHFYLLQLVNTSLNIVYSIQANKPIKSQMQGIYNESKTFLIYAQYYQNLSIITLFSSQFKNLTFYQDQFIQIAIPLRKNPFLYILYEQYISQFIITQNHTFLQKQQQYFNEEAEAEIFQVYYNYQVYSSCDQLLINFYPYNNRIITSQYLGCQNNFFTLFQFNNIYSNQPKLIQSFLNNQFLIFQSQQYLTLYKIYELMPFAYTEIKNNTQIYFNIYDNYLFTFNTKIIVYELKIPQLQINLTDQQVQGITYDITIYAKQYNLISTSICKMFMSITILDQNDTNIYVMFNKNFYQYRSISDYEIDQQIFVGYSGQLLKYTVNKDNKQFGQFSQTTYQEKLLYINEQFYLAQLSYCFINNNYRNLCLIGVTNELIQIFFLLMDYNYYEFFMDINIPIKAQSLQVVSNDYEDLIIGVSDNNTIYLYQIYAIYNPPNYSSQEFKFEQQFQQFLITYNNLITLFINQEIQIMNLNSTDLVIINETIINQLFNRDSQLKFNPIQITVNNQQFSSCLFINNINNVIIISIDQSNIPIPISIIEVKFQIKQINIVNQQLVLSYICNYGFDLCFQVWSIQNFKYPFFMRNMPNVQNKNNIQILSDDWFFYVQFQNYNLYVYNPKLPQHMSLYYLLILSSKLISTIQYSLKSILYFETYINSLSTEQNFQFKVNQSLNFSHSYPQLIYNYTITSLVNQTANQTTPNQSLTYLSNFTYFQPKTTITVDLLIQDLNLTDRTFTIPVNIILDRQASLCYFPKSSDVDKIDKKVDQFDQQYFTNDECNLTNFVYFTKNIELNYTQVTAVNNKFFILQNNSAIRIVNQYFEFLQSYDYSNLNFTECLKSTSYNLSLSSICQNDTAQYWLSIYFDSNGIVINRSLLQIAYKFTFISKISNIAALNFILGSYNQNSQNLYLLNPLNNSIQLLISDCQDFSVSLYNSSLDMNQANLVIIIYISNYYDVFYQYLYFNKYSITQSNFLVLFSDNLLYAQILILQIIDKQIFFLITSTEGFGYLLFYKLFQNQLSFQDLITTIPAYVNDDIVLVPNFVYSNGFLLQQFKQGNTYIIGVYYITDLLINNLEEPILMLGQLNSTSSEYALITNIEDRNATCLALNNGSILYYPIYTRTLKCHYRQNRNAVHVNIACQNDFSNGAYEITLILPELDKPSKRWIYSLITIISFQLIGFYILVKYRMRNIGYINTEIEL